MSMYLGVDSASILFSHGSFQTPAFPQPSFFGWFSHAFPGNPAMAATSRMWPGLIPTRVVGPFNPLKGKLLAGHGGGCSIEPMKSKTSGGSEDSETAVLLAHEMGPR